MNVKELREKHKTFRYDGFNTSDKGCELDVSFHFSITPDIEFTPRVTIPIVGSLDKDSIAVFAFHLGLIEAVSYWKSTCSPELIIEIGSLTDQQVKWWHNLFMHGLGEFFYQNNIDFTMPDFLTIKSDKRAPMYKTTQLEKADGDLIMVGGGKDSIVTLDSLSGFQQRTNVMLVNPTDSATKTAQTAGFRDPILIKKIIDPRLLQLNEKGYLNGHTPFSAYLSFLGIFAAMLHGYQQVIVSNEASAGEGNIKFYGMEVNHQYSKSYEYEKLFREYCQRYLKSDVTYFSFLRPLYELQIGALFAKTEKYDEVFCSCNVSRNQYWCGKCPKCAFVYMILAPFMERGRVKKIFGLTDFFEKPEIQRHITDLVGLGEHKPFDCVGTEDESRLAVAMAIQSFKLDGLKIPVFLQTLASRLNLAVERERSFYFQKLQNDWDNNHFLPEAYEPLLKEKLLQL